jgi:ornithine racemase
MPSEMKAVITFADGSLNSELETIRQLSKMAVALEKRHKVLLMVEVGDLREGIMPDDVLTTVERILSMPNIDFDGLGTNQACYGGTIPSLQSLRILTQISVLRLSASTEFFRRFYQAGTLPH